MQEQLFRPDPHFCEENRRQNCPPSERTQREINRHPVGTLKLATSLPGLAIQGLVFRESSCAVEPFHFVSYEDPEYVPGTSPCAGWDDVRAYRFPEISTPVVRRPRNPIWHIDADLNMDGSLQLREGNACLPRYRVDVRRILEFRSNCRAMAQFRLISSVLLIATSLGAANAEDIRGTVVIKRRLTRQRVTAAHSLYERGPAVELRSDPQDDPLASERARVVIYVEGQFAANPVTATMEQKDRRFIPELLVIPVGSTVTFPNLDPIFHNVFSLSKPKSFDLGNYAKDHTRTVTFAKPGVEFVNCHLHPNMSAAIMVTPNAWRAVADRDGRFVLRDLPAGPYTVVAWHKAAGFFKRTVTVAPNRGGSVEFFIPLDENGVRSVEARR